MVQYTLSIQDPHHQYIQIEILFKTTGNKTEVCLPVWRPGRYELGNFAKNVRNFHVYGSKNTPLEFSKINHSTWEIATENESEIKVRYQYYASELNAGSTFLSPEQLYVNPVNCLAFIRSQNHLPCQIELLVPANYQIACQLEKKGNRLMARDFDQLADSPFIASPSLQHETYQVDGVQFHLWFQGMKHINWERIIKDFSSFCKKQIEKFTEFPVSEYHFLFQIVPYKAYHGVEHQASTVILLGPTYDVFGSLYPELMGVSSHELYHTWNVKAIRPIEMQPYDFTKENYSPLGFLCEGVTTYMGDLFLWKSGYFSEKQYFEELQNQLQKHFDNPARFNTSVADSSLDTWLDGYVPGAPGRKVSIYTEGCLLAFATDVRLAFESNNKYGLDEVMRRLYFDFALKGKGVSEDDYFDILTSITGTDWDEWRSFYFHGTKAYEPLLVQAFERLGMNLLHQPSKEYKEAKCGIKTIPSGHGEQVVAIYPGATADMAGLMLDDVVISVNGMTVHQDLNQWLTYFDDESKKLTILRKGKIHDLILPELNRYFYNTYAIQKMENPTQVQLKAFEKWAK